MRIFEEETIPHPAYKKKPSASRSDLYGEDENVRRKQEGAGEINEGDSGFIDTSLESLEVDPDTMTAIMSSNTSIADIEEEIGVEEEVVSATQEMPMDPPMKSKQVKPQSEPPVFNINEVKPRKNLSKKHSLNKSLLTK